MISKSKRLSKKSFDNVIKEGSVANTSLLMIKFLINQDGMRISAVSPKKIYKTAVHRNKSRRLLYNTIKELNLTNIQNTHIIIFPKKSILGVDRDLLIKELRNIFVKAGIMR